jgi:branched-chain amino acid aminotransferase
MGTLTEAGAAFALHRNPSPASDAVRKKALADLKFGTVFTDHMARATWSRDGGWADRRVEPYGPLSLDPAAAVLHYAQEVFEGLKAYKHADGSIWLFRPEANAERFQASARRLALPELSTEDFLGSIDALVAVDRAWVPDTDESSLYLRPFMFASEAFIGVRPAHVIDYLLIASPVGPYFTTGVKPVSIWVAQGFHRAGPGGTGAAKTGGNYASSLAPQSIAYENGCQQVLFTDAATDTYLEELGGMNLFLVRKDGTVETPRLSGTILEGITRHSVLRLLEDQDVKVVERDISLAELREGAADGDVAEVFACGTAAVLTPVARLKGESFDVTVGGGGAGEGGAGEGTAGEVTTRIRRELMDIQYGRAVDPYGWMRRIR